MSSIELFELIAVDSIVARPLPVKAREVNAKPVIALDKEKEIEKQRELAKLKEQREKLAKEVCEPSITIDTLQRAAICRRRTWPRNSKNRSRKNAKRISIEIANGIDC